MRVFSQKVSLHSSIRIHAKYELTTKQNRENLLFLHDLDEHAWINQMEQIPISIVSHSLGAVARIRK